MGRDRHRRQPRGKRSGVRTAKARRREGFEEGDRDSSGPAPLSLAGAPRMSGRTRRPSRDPGQTIPAHAARAPRSGCSTSSIAVLDSLDRVPRAPRSPCSTPSIALLDSLDRVPRAPRSPYSTPSITFLDPLDRRTRLPRSRSSIPSIAVLDTLAPPARLPRSPSSPHSSTSIAFLALRDRPPRSPRSPAPQPRAHAPALPPATSTHCIDSSLPPRSFLTSRPSWTALASCRSAPGVRVSYT